MKINEEKFVANFGKNLRKIRRKNKLPQEYLANSADIPISQIGRFERGEIKTTIGTLFVIAKALNISVKDLFGFKIIEKPKN